MNKSKILKFLSELPEEIKVREEDLIDKAERIEELNVKLKILETETYSEVESETDKEDKKIYSNDSKRKLETESRLKENGDYIESLEEQKKLKKNIKVEEIALSYNKRLFRASEALTRIGGT